MENGQVALGAVLLRRHKCTGFRLYGEAGAQRSDRVLLDGTFQDRRLAEIDVRLSARLSAPFLVSNSAVIYQLEISAEKMSGDARGRREMVGMQYINKAGCITSRHWLAHSHSWRISDDDWLAKAVASSYIDRIAKHEFWRTLFLHASGGVAAPKLADVRLCIRSTRLVPSSEAVREENELGALIAAMPGCVPHAGAGALDPTSRRPIGNAPSPLRHKGAVAAAPLISEQKVA
jgi:hypothetical protein